MLGEQLEPQHQRILTALKDTDSNVRWGAARLLGKVGKFSVPSAEQLAAALSDESWCVRRAAAESLGNLGAAAAPYTDQLLSTALNDTDSDVRRAATEAFGFQGEAAARHANSLAAFISDRDENKYVRISAMSALASLGATVAGQHLKRFGEDALQAGEAEVRIAAARTLGSLGAAAMDCRDVLETVSERDVDESVRQAAAEALEAIPRPQMEYFRG